MLQALQRKGILTFLSGGAFALLVNLFVQWLRQKRAAAKAAKVTNGASGPTSKGLLDVDQTLSLIKSRRSIFPKDYNGNGHTVTDAEIRKLLEGANWAPTHKRTEPWRFVVFRGAKAIDKVLQATIEGNRCVTDEERGGQSFEDFCKDFQQSIVKKWKRCDVLISLGMLRQAVPDHRLPEWEEVSALACAVQNMHLVATSLGLAGYWSSWNVAGRDSEAMAQLLGLSKEAGDRCLGFFALGSSDLVGKVRAGRRPVEEKTRWES